MLGQNMWIGKANRLANVGELVSVKINNKVVQAKVARSFASLNVLVVKTSTGEYFAYPDKVERQRDVKRKEISKHDPRKTPDKETIDTVLIYAVKVNTLAPCTYSYWNRRENECIESCADGLYTSRQTCISNLPPPIPPNENPFASRPIYNVGYFKRGFLSVLGAPSEELGFFYPIGISQAAPLCRGNFLPTGFTQNNGRDVIMGDGTYANRKWLIPRTTGASYDVYMALQDSRSVSHGYYPDTRITSGVLQQWNNFYRLQFYSDGRGILLHDSSDFISLGNNPWETSLQKLNADGTPVEFGEGTEAGEYAGAFKWIGFPNWIWRQIDINAIAIFDTIYFSGNQSFFYQDTFTISANLNRRYLSTDPEFTYTNIVNPGQVLPPASIISCDYFADENGVAARPVPPGGGWTLLWDTATCPSGTPGQEDNPPPVVELPLYSFKYYLVVNGGEPIHLVDFREDDPHSIFLTNLGDGRYRCGIRSGYIRIDIGAGDTDIRYYKLRIFSSDSPDVEEFIYPEVPEPYPEDWADVFYEEWVTTNFQDTLPCLVEFSNSTSMNIQPNENIVTGLTPDVNNPEDILNGSAQWLFSAYNYQSIVNEEGLPACQITPIKEDISVFIPQIGVDEDPDDVGLVTIKIYYKGKL
jgi:hypothetical protein